MKTLMLILVAVFTLNVAAQNKNRNHQERTHEKGEFFKDLTPEEAADLKTKKMTLDLDLNRSQQKQVKAIVLEDTKNKQAKRKEREANKANNDGKKLTKEERLALINEKLDREIALKQEMKSVLSDEQYKKWERTKSRKNGKKRVFKHKQRKEHQN